MTATPTLEQALARIDAAIENPPRTTIEQILEEKKNPTVASRELQHLLGGAELNLTNVQLLWRLISAGSLLPGAYQQKYRTPADRRGSVCGSTVLPYLQQEMSASDLAAFVAKYPIEKYSDRYFRQYANALEEVEDAMNNYGGV